MKTVIRPIAWVGWCVLISTLALLPGTAPGANSYWISAKDSNACIVSAVIQYDAGAESEIRKENGIAQPVLLVDVNVKDPTELCSLLVFQQGKRIWRPLICITETRRNIYHGYIILPEDFALNKPLNIRLGNRAVSMTFIQ